MSDNPRADLDQAISRYVAESTGDEVLVTAWTLAITGVNLTDAVGVERLTFETMPGQPAASSLGLAVAASQHHARAWV